MIRGDKVLIRALEPEDVELLYQWENNMKLWDVSNTLVPFSKFQLKKYIESASLDLYQTKQLRLIIEKARPSDASIIGMVDMFDFDPYHRRAGVGIVIHEDFRGKGYAFQALELFVGYVFKYLGLHQVYCNISEQNTISIKLFESLGFQLVGKKKDWVKTIGGFEDELMYQLISCKNS